MKFLNHTENNLNWKLNYRMKIAGAILCALAAGLGYHDWRSGKTVTVPAGNSLLVKLDNAVSSSDKPGTKFSGVLQGDLSANGNGRGQDWQRCLWRGHGFQEGQTRARQSRGDLWR
jgi:hypothetical protein